MRKLLGYFAVSFLVGLSSLSAQNNQVVHLRGRVLDSSGLPMAATSVKLYQGLAAPREGTPPFKEGQSDRVGDFDFEVPPGDYRVAVTAPDFDPSEQTVRVTANMQPLAITLSLTSIETVVNVSGLESEVGVDPESSLTTDLITGDDLLDLPDNEEDLLTYLQELAAARGIVDGDLNIRVDGFENSFLPNRSEIQEIRIVNSSFSAESNSTGPRIEIITRPGTGFWSGDAGLTFADESLNAAAPLTGRKPASQTRNFNGQFRGPIIPGRITATFSLQNQVRESEGNAIRAVGINGPVNEGVANLNKNRTFRFSPNITLNRTNTLVSNFTYSTSRNDNSGVGGFNLPERASNRRGDNWSVQLTERATLSSRFTNELRFQARQSSNQNVPVTDAMAVNVADAFNGGGATTRSSSSSRDYMLADQIRWQPARSLTLTSAVQVDYHKRHSDSQNNYLGTYSFSSLQDYCYAENFPGTNCQATKAIVDAAIHSGVAPTFTNSAGNVIPITGVPTQFTISGGDPVLDVYQGELSAFFQGEWRVSPRAQLSFGARYQVQQHLDDYNNIAPALGLSYQLNRTQNWQTVVRAGARMNYSTFNVGSWEQLLRNDGLSRQYNIVVLNPSYPTPDLSSFLDAGERVANSFRVRADDFVAPYAIQPSVSVDQNLPGGNRLSFNFQISRGVHQSRNRNINAPYPGTPLPADLAAQLNSRDQTVRNAARSIVDQMRPYYPLVSNITQQESRGLSLTKNFSIQYRTNNKSILGNRVLIGGYVTWSMNWASDDNGNPVNSYDLASEWGRSGSDQRHRITGSLNIQVPGNMRFSFRSIGWSSGRPYSITTGRDENGDGSSNDRAAGYLKNSETGPATWSNIRMSFTKTFVLGGSAPRPSANNYAEPQRGGGGFGGGGFGGGRGRQDGRQIQFTVNVNNLFNSTTRTGISGVLSSPLFGQPTGGGQGRSITLGIRTNLGRLF